MKAHMTRNWPIWSAAAMFLVLMVGALISFTITTALIGHPHEGSAAFEKACLQKQGVLFESRASGICYSTDGKILLSTGVGGFTNYK